MATFKIENENQVNEKAIIDDCYYELEIVGQAGLVDISISDFFQTMTMTLGQSELKQLIAHLQKQVL